MTKSPYRYKVHIGYTASGLDCWRFFLSLEATNAFCEAVARRSGDILTILDA